MKYILRKLLTLIITLFIVSLLAFLAFQVIPGSPATSMLGTNATPEKVAQLEEEMGLDDPVLVRYGRWVADFVQGDWGSLTATTCRSRTWCWRSCRPRRPWCCWPSPSRWRPPSPWGLPRPGGRGAGWTGSSRWSIRSVCPFRRCLWASCCALSSGSPCGCLYREILCPLQTARGNFSSTCSSRPWRWPCPGWR